jgi:hypothetical protein
VLSCALAGLAGATANAVPAAKATAIAAKILFGLPSTITFPPETNPSNIDAGDVDPNNGFYSSDIDHASGASGERSRSSQAASGWSRRIDLFNLWSVIDGSIPSVSDSSLRVSVKTHHPG